MLSLAAAVEAATRHPLADAVLAEAAARSLHAASSAAAEAASTSPGRGVRARVGGRWVAVGKREWALEAVGGGGGGPAEGEGGALHARAPPPPGVEGGGGAGASCVWVAAEGEGLVGRLWLRDVLRPDAVATVAALRAEGKRVRVEGGPARLPAHTRFAGR